jgi:hypothetical protein
MTVQQKFEGWFATSFWVDMHYALAALGTLVIIVVYLVHSTFSVGFAGFDVGLWTTAIGNDKLNMPAVGN